MEFSIVPGEVPVIIQCPLGIDIS